MVDDQNETTNEPGLVARQAAPRPLLLWFLLLLPAFASCSCSLLLLLNHVSLSPAVELEWLVRVFGGFREFNVAFFQKPPELPRRSPPPKVCLFGSNIFLLTGKLTCLFYSLLIASSLIEECWSIGLGLCACHCTSATPYYSYCSEHSFLHTTFRSPIPLR